MSVFQRKGHWYLSVTVNGRRIRRAIKEAQTKRQAERAERILRDEIYENRYGNGGQKLFSDFVENCYKPYAKEHKRGYNVEVSILKVLMEKFGTRKLSEITPEVVEIFKRQRASEITSHGRYRAKSTVNRDIAVLSAVFNLAEDFGDIRENPVKRIKFYTNLTSRERILSELEENILFDFIRDDLQFSRKVEILLYTGIRRGELFKLEWRDIDLTDGFINIRKETTKTGKARSVPMLSNVQEIFQFLRHEAEYVDEFEKIFFGAPSRAGTFTKKFGDICKLLDLKNLTVHSLRHTFSTRADKYGIGVFAQKALLGHARLSMTDRYTHISKETLKANIVHFEKFIALRKVSKY